MGVKCTKGYLNLGQDVHMGCLACWWPSGRWFPAIDWLKTPAVSLHEPLSVKSSQGRATKHVIDVRRLISDFASSLKKSTFRQIEWSSELSHRQRFTSSPTHPYAEKGYLLRTKHQEFPFQTVWHLLWFLRCSST